MRTGQAEMPFQSPHRKFVTMASFGASGAPAVPARGTPNAHIASMSLIQNFMPSYRLHQVDHVAVAADPARAFATVRSLDFYRIGFARRLFALRAAPERALARLRGQPAPSLASTARIEQITAPGTGFHFLGE